MPIFRVKSVKIYTGQKNLHWRRRPRRRQLSGMSQVSCQPPSTNSTTSSLKKISSDVMHPHVSNLPGHLLQVLLAVHGVVDHQLSCTWCVVRHIESIKTLISTTITTAYHILVNENFNWCDTSYCQQPPWSSHPCCPRRPHCRPPPNNMSKK